MGRRTRNIVLAVSLAALASVVVGAIAARQTIVKNLVINALTARGVPAPRLTVSDVGWRSSRIADIRLGAADELSLRDLHVTYTFAGLLAGRIDEVTADGLHIRVDLTGETPPLGSLHTMFSGRDTEARSTGGLPVSNIAISDMRVTGQTDRGDFLARGSGWLRNDDTGTEAELTVPEVAVDGDPLATGLLALDLSRERAEASLSIQGLAGGFSIDATGRVNDPFDKPRWRLDLVARGTADSPVWAMWPGPSPTAGRAEVTLRGKGELPPLEEYVSTDHPVTSLLAQEFEGSINLFVADLTLPDRVDGTNIGARLSMAGREGNVAVSLHEAVSLSIASAAPAFLQELGLPSTVASQLAKGVSARLEPPAAGAPITVGTDRGDTIVAVDGRLSLTAPGTAELSTTLPVDIRFAGDRLHFELRQPADLRLTSLTYDDVVELLKPTDLKLPEGKLTLHTTDVAEDGLDYRVAIGGGPLALRLHRTGRNAVDATIAPGQFTVTPSRSQIEDARIDLPSYGMRADGVSATIETADSATRIEFNAARVGQTSDDTLFASVAVAGNANRKDDVWQVSATATGPNGAGKIDATGVHHADTGRGSADIKLEALEFEPGGLQPGIFLTGLPVLEDATGEVSAAAKLSWTPKGLGGTATVSLNDMTFTAPQARIEGLNLDLRLDSLFPLSSPPDQTLTVRRLEPGLPMDRLEIRFQIQPTEPPSLAIQTGEVFFGSGRFNVDSLVVDPAADRRHVDLRVEDLSIAELFALLGLDGLSGEGRLSGTIPMDFADGTVVIENGHLAAAAPGVIRFRSEQAAQILAGQGESLDLVLRALEDFRYDELTVDLNKSADDVGQMKLSLLGKNPAVLEGHPFRFNINVEANTGKLVAALTTIYQVPNDFLRRAWTSRP